MQIKLLFLIFIFFVAGCHSESHSPQDLINSLPRETPAQMVEFDSVDSLFLQHLGYETIVRDDGSFILPDREAALLIHVDESGNLIRQLGRKGRGPGEFLDITFSNEIPGGGILIYDQGNNKNAIFDRNLKYQTEFIPESYDGAAFYLLATGSSGIYIAVMTTDSWMFDKEAERKLILARYDQSRGSFSNIRKYPTRPYARLFINGQMMGGTAVPYLPDHLIRYKPTTETLYTYWTASDKIAVRNTEFDTLRTISIDLPREELSSSEIDSLREEYSKEQWDTLSDMLPERKVPVEDMYIDDRERFWLRLNYRSEADTQMWLVTDKEGEPQKIIHLPKGVMLTHVSVHHLGVRLGPSSFALYEPIE